MIGIEKFNLELLGVKNLTEEQKKRIEESIKEAVNSILEDANRVYSNLNHDIIQD